MDNAPIDVQLELIDLQSDTVLAEHFKSASVLFGGEFSKHEETCSEDVGSFWIYLYM